MPAPQLASSHGPSTQRIAIPGDCGRHRLRLRPRRRAILAHGHRQGARPLPWQSPPRDRALQSLQAAGLPARIAGRRTPLSGLNPAIPDQIPDVILESGPLGGIHAALSASTARWNLFLPVDMPLMPASLLRALLDRAMLTAAPITALRLSGRLEPLPVVLDRAILAPSSPSASRRASAPAASHGKSIPAELRSGAVLDAPDCRNSSAVRPMRFDPSGPAAGLLVPKRQHPSGTRLAASPEQWPQLHANPPAQVLLRRERSDAARRFRSRAAGGISARPNSMNRVLLRQPMRELPATKRPADAAERARVPNHRGRAGDCRQHRNGPVQ